MDPPRIAEKCRHPWLILSGPKAHPVCKSIKYDPGIIREALCSFSIHPSALVLQGLRQVPVVESDVRLNPGSAEFVHEAIVEVETFLVRAALAPRNDAWPRNRKAIIRKPELLH